MSARAFRGDSRGNIAVMFALGFAVSVAVSAVAVDAAALYHERRIMQNAVDLAALAAATDPYHAAALARQTLVEARLLEPDSTTGLTVTTGRYGADAALAPEGRFTPGSVAVNAVRVSFTRPGTLHFAAGWSSPPQLGASATAAVTPEVAFSIGTRLASLKGGIANALLNGLLGTNVNVSLADYNSLLNAEVDLLAFLDALASRLGITVGTYNDLLHAEARQGDIARAIAGVLTGTEHFAANVIAKAIGPGANVPLQRLFNLGAVGNLALGSSSGGLLADIAVLELLGVSAALSDGANQVALSLEADIPGLTGMSATLAAGERRQEGTASWFAIGKNRTLVRTAQIRLKLVSTILGSGALASVPVRFPLAVTAAYAEASVSQASCPSPANRHGTATIDTLPGAVRATLGEVKDSDLANFDGALPVTLAKLAEVKLLGVTILQILGTATAKIEAPAPIPVHFTSDDIADQRIKTVRVSNPVASLMQSVLGSLQVQTPVLGLGLSPGAVLPLLKSILNPLMPTLDLVVARLLNVLGLSVGEADVQVHAVRCGPPVLVG